MYLHKQNMYVFIYKCNMYIICAKNVKICITFTIIYDLFIKYMVLWVLCGQIILKKI